MTYTGSYNLPGYVTSYVLKMTYTGSYNLPGCVTQQVQGWPQGKHRQQKNSKQQRPSFYNYKIIIAIYRTVL